MDAIRTWAAVVPCFNEAEAIAGLVRDVRRHVATVIVVDDSSTDGTATLAEQAGARVLRHARNRGKGAALKTGLAEAARLGCSHAVTLDGDGQHVADDIPLLAECAARTGAALVIGNRMHQAQRLPWVRRWVNRWMSRRISQRAGQAWPDTQCGFRLIQLAEWQALTLRTEHFEIESEMLLAFAAAGQRVEFVPIRAVGRGARSRIHPLIDAWRWLMWWRESRKRPGP